MRAPRRELGGKGRDRPVAAGSVPRLREVKCPPWARGPAAGPIAAPGLIAGHGGPSVSRANLGLEGGEQSSSRRVGAELVPASPGTIPAGFCVLSASRSTIASGWLPFEARGKNQNLTGFTF